MKKLLIGMMIGVFLGYGWCWMALTTTHKTEMEQIIKEHKDELQFVKKLYKEWRTAKWQGKNSR